MDKLIIKGGKKLKGRVDISGAKNAALPILAATLLTDERCIVKNVPMLTDITTMIKILGELGKSVKRVGSTLVVKTQDKSRCVAPYELVSTMRGSICVLGPLVGKRKKAKVSFPGGCVIGPRPIDLHLKGLRDLGIGINVKGGYIIGNGKEIKGTRIYLGGHFGSSVLATANVLMASVLAKGKTVIENAACEPEIADLVRFLKKMGAKIHGAGSPRLEISGVRYLKGCTHALIPDRIEAGTYMLATAITKGDVYLRGGQFDNLLALIDKMREAGVSIEKKGKGIRVRHVKGIKPIDVTTLPYPGFPTDLQAQMMALMAITQGISVITEKIYPERFIHISELNRMGARIVLEGPNAIIKGVEHLSGAPVMASDLRASASLVLAGLVAKGTTEISRIYHLDRGYENLEIKLQKIGADIKRVKE
ncbi:MAG: UDP-N-acetylglucosamine 1-carboxyvinyltransferase [Candidatus Omnitrophica bacterium]|nr:UDP-N-acetylglucosamine 1-carboxyvinyltransferase [Candidatus Omnitrophota bacterium]